MYFGITIREKKRTAAETVLSVGFRTLQMYPQQRSQTPQNGVLGMTLNSIRLRSQECGAPNVAMSYLGVVVSV